MRPNTAPEAPRVEELGSASQNTATEPASADSR